MPGWRLSNIEAMGVDKQCLQSFAIVALGVKEKVTSGSDILSFAYSGVESLEAPPLPRKSNRKSNRLQARRACCSSCTSGRLTVSVATANVAHVRPSTADLVVRGMVLQACLSQVKKEGEEKHWLWWWRAERSSSPVKLTGPAHKLPTFGSTH